MKLALIGCCPDSAALACAAIESPQFSLVGVYAVETADPESLQRISADVPRHGDWRKLLAGDEADALHNDAERHFLKAVDILAGMKNELELARAYRSFSALRDRQGMSDDGKRLRTLADEIYNRLHGAAAAD